MKPSVIVWDLETVPDVGGFAAANDLVGKTDAEVREALGEKFPKHIYHSIVCIGALMTIGMIRVAPSAALTVGVKWATMTSTPRRTRSSASSSARSLRPPV